MTLGVDEKVVAVGLNPSAVDPKVSGDTRLVIWKPNEATGKTELPPNTAKIILYRANQAVVQHVKGLACGVPIRYAADMAEANREIVELLDGVRSGEPSRANLNPAGSDPARLESVDPPADSPIAEIQIPEPFTARQFVTLNLPLVAELGPYQAAKKLHSMLDGTGQHAAVTWLSTLVKQVRGEGPSRGKKSGAPPVVLPDELRKEIERIVDLNRQLAAAIASLLPTLQRTIEESEGMRNRIDPLEQETRRLRGENQRLLETIQGVTLALQKSKGPKP